MTGKVVITVTCPMCHTQTPRELDADQWARSDGREEEEYCMACLYVLDNVRHEHDEDRAGVYESWDDEGNFI